MGQSSCFLGDEKYMTDCHFVQDEPPVNSSTNFNLAQINTVGIEIGLMKHIWLCLSHSVFYDRRTRLCLESFHWTQHWCVSRKTWLLWHGYDPIHLHFSAIRFSRTRLQIVFNGFIKGKLYEVLREERSWFCHFIHRGFLVRYPTL